MGVGFARDLKLLNAPDERFCGAAAKECKTCLSTIQHTGHMIHIHLKRFGQSWFASVGENAALCLYNVTYPYCHCLLCFKVSELRIGGGEINVSVNGDNESAETWTWCALVVSCHCVSMLKQFFATHISQYYHEVYKCASAADARYNVQFAELIHVESDMAAVSAATLQQTDQGFNFELCVFSLCLE